MNVVVFLLVVAVFVFLGAVFHRLAWGTWF